MRCILRILAGCLCLTLCLSVPCFAKEWRGIVPLHTTRSEVVKLLGEPKHTWETVSGYFDLPDARVTIEWIDPSCMRKYPIYTLQEGARPDDLVLNISVTPKKPFPEEELHLPPLKPYLTDCIVGAKGSGGCTLMDKEEGFVFSTSKGGVTRHSYYPTAAEYKAWMQEHGTCQSSR